ncbi:S1C family serine protease [Streptomyces sp. MUM 178J]|uniref:S1C family serine protease n=1 Tax=Streptomyces sp. MUM 178J TaxID=2791991 RepID=UPI001F0455C9|nr:trypsin-like peptidase domain-containing protein [Streptomyces sp. MUM 178J]WRQ79070.1 trypsin-like peptidase domain-containing protein [Streptomyces sp. MUM 178J]
MSASLRRRTTAAVIGAISLIALAGGCSSGSPAPVSQGQARSTPESSNQAAGRAAVPRAASALQDDYQNVIENVLPSVVQIEADNSLGSGVVYDDKGHIVTNAHVVGGERSMRVTTATREQPLTAELVFSYPEQDLAVVKLERVPSGLKPAAFANSAEVEVGQIVLAMGSPLGLASSVTQGIVSAVGRAVTTSAAGGGVSTTFGNMVQTSAAINPGNSGGALVDLDGEVVGVPTLAATDPDLGGTAAPGIGFAIPSSTVRSITDQIIEDGEVTDSGRAALGIRGRTVLNADYEPSGVAVVEVTPGGAAAEAGLKSGDIITRVGDEEITTITSLAETLASLKPGDTVDVEYTRGGTARSAEVTLGELE